MELRGDLFSRLRTPAYPAPFPGIRSLNPSGRTVIGELFPLFQNPVPDVRQRRGAGYRNAQITSQRVVNAERPLHFAMHRVLLRFNPVRPITAIRQIQPLLRPQVSMRNLSFLNQGNEYLLKLLDDNGFSNLKSPLEGLPKSNEYALAQPDSDVPSVLWATPE